MRKLFIILLVGVSAICIAQDSIPIKANHDVKVSIKDGVNIHRSGTEYHGDTYTEVYEVITDSIVHRFGMVFSKDSTFIKRESRDGIIRSFYDEMQRNDKWVMENKDIWQEETEYFIKTYRASYEVWSYFKLLGILKW